MPQNAKHKNTHAHKLLDRKKETGNTRYFGFGNRIRRRVVSFQCPSRSLGVKVRLCQTWAEIIIMCGSIEVDVWRARLGLFAARIVGRLPKGWRKIKKQVASVLFTQSVFAGGGVCSCGCGSNFKHKRETSLLAVLMSLLLAASVMNVSLLLRCGDIETNPGPGRYPGMPVQCYCSHSKLLGYSDNLWGQVA